MALPQLTKKQIEKTLAEYCDSRVPKHIRHQLRLEFAFRGNTVSIYEVRPVWDDPTRFTEGPVAQFRFDPKAKTWTLYWRDRNLKWHVYDRKKPSRTFDSLLKEVDADPTGIFWG